MKRQVIQTSDGSSTFYIPELNEHYHSKFGALTESMHIFIKNGLLQSDAENINVLEIGFGTGLNAILTLVESEKLKRDICYEAIEKYPLSWEEVELLHYDAIINSNFYSILRDMHHCKWEVITHIHQYFMLKKVKTDLLNYQTSNKFDVIYFDAFAPDLQPDLWSAEIFTKLYSSLNNNGILVTYSTKGTVKRNLTGAGFKIEKFTGPEGGKKECLRAIKII